MRPSEACGSAAAERDATVTLRPVRFLTRSLPLLLALSLFLAVLTVARGADPAAAYAGAPWFKPGTTYLDLSLPDEMNSNFPDASIISDGGTYYAYGATTGGAYLPVMSSTDLVHWTARPAYPDPTGGGDPFFNDALPFAPSWGVEVPGANHPRLRKELWAPGAAKIGDQFVVFHAVRVSNASDRFCIGASTSSDPLGPFTDSGGPLVCDVQGDPNGSIDPQPFVDQDGTPYLVWKSEGVPFREPTKIWVQQLSGSGTSFAPGSTPHALLATSAAWEGNVIENPSMVRWNGKLYLFYSANEWVSADYAIGYAECTSVLGPCTKMTNEGPLLGSRGARLGPGGPAAFVDADGRLMLAHHYWLAPYIGYPANPNCDGNGTCTTQGQRRLTVDEVVPTNSGGIAVVPMSQGGSCGSGSTSASVAAGSFNPLPPARILDTRTGLNTLRFPVGQRKSIVVDVRGQGGVPDDARVSAVALNVTATDSTLGGFLSVHPTDVSLPDISNLNMVPGQTVPNLVIAKVGTDGNICIANDAGTTAVVADVVGWFDSSRSSGGSFTPLANPTRVMDTRQTLSGAVGTDEVQLPLSPPPGATGVVMNVTADAPTHSQSFVTVWPTGQPRPNASSLNMVAGETAPNLVFAQLGDGNRVSFQNQFGTTHLIADVVGWIGGSPAGSGNYTPVAPARILDTRSGVGAAAAKVGGDTTLDFRVTGVGGVPANASAVVVNLTVTQPSAQTWVTAYPTGEARPTASNLNVVGGQTRPNLVVARVGAGGMVSIYNFNGDTHLVADVVGWFD
jgi:hypothetical protein